MLRAAGPVCVWSARAPSWFGTESEGWFSAMDFGDEPRLLLNADEVPWSINLSVRTEIAREVGGFPEDLGRVGTSLRSGEEFPFVGGIRRTGRPDRVRARRRGLACGSRGTTADALVDAPRLGRGDDGGAARHATGTEPLDALHATAHVTLRDWGPFVKQLRGPLPTSEVLVSELSKRVAGVGRVSGARRGLEHQDSAGMSRVIAIGLDSVEATLLERCVDDGRLPHLAQLRERAATIDLTSPTEYRAEFPWGEFVTGRRADSLRYWGTVAFDASQYDAFMRGAPDAEPFYTMGNDATVIAFDVPKVMRSPGVRGVQTLGWGAHSPQYPVGSLPPGELDAVLAEFGPHPGLQVEYDGAWHQPDYLAEFGRRQASSIRTRSQMLPWLAKRSPDWDLFVTLIGETHQLGHMTFHGFEGRLAEAPTAGIGRAAMLGALDAIDELIGDVMTWAPEDAVIVVFTVQGMTHADDETAASLLAEILLRTSTGEARFPTADLRSWRRRGAPPVIPGTWDSPASWAERRYRSTQRATKRDGRQRVSTPPCRAIRAGSASTPSPGPWPGSSAARLHPGQRSHRVSAPRRLDQ